MSKLKMFLPSAKVANVLIIALCLFECLQLYRLGFNRGYELAVDQLVDTEVVIVRTLNYDNGTKP